MIKLVIKGIIALVLLLIVGGSGTLDAQNKKKSKKEQKWELEHKAFIEKTAADLASGAADPNKKNGHMTWLGSALPNYYDDGSFQDPELALLLINAKGIKINEWNIMVQPERSWHFTALMTSVSSPDLVKLLLDKGASINMQDSWTDWQGKVVDGGNTPLMLAAAANPKEEAFTNSAKILIDRGTNIELINWYGDNALMLGVHNTEIAKILIDKGAKLDVVNLSGQTALMLAAPKYPEVVKLLIDKGANIKPRQVPKYDYTPNALDCAAQFGNIESAKLILARAATLGIKDEIIRCAVRFAVIGNQVEMAKYLIDQEGAKTEIYSTQQQMTPLMETSMLEMVQLLVDRGANVNANNNNMYTPLYQAIANFRKPTLKAKDNEKILNLLLDKGANIDFPVVGGVTPLMGAMEKPESAKTLIDKGAKLDLQNSNGETALMYAVKGGLLKVSMMMPVVGAQVETVKYLISKGADVNLQDKWGKTALMHAAGAVYAQGNKYSTYTEVLEFLLTNGANLEATDKEGHTALYWAQRLGRNKSAELLLAKGANPAKKYDRATDKSNIKAGIVGTWSYNQKIDSPLEHKSYTMTSKVVFNADWSYSKSIISSGQVIPDGGGYDTYDLRDGKIWLFNKMGTNAVLEFRFEGSTLILNGEKYNKAVKK